MINPYSTMEAFLKEGMLFFPLIKKDINVKFREWVMYKNFRRGIAKRSKSSF
ncbi:hypothetical protein JCM9157_3362 [Halalkalibacter akibai JCM 9157]|uniref:Uncharacterized protein n=1 Tax=Halalkalibacter akibai (strain ATCC 43226 / DSM 21942 / CIP 109018 / JCM 9157 / 1139) TaxID=1236973 RepID=W4QVM4_HALA3|nr:hypothetical protein JCM9157_3362 [Halalkalibacter akibai JCM 9157]